MGSLFSLRPLEFQSKGGSHSINNLFILTAMITIIPPCQPALPMPWFLDIADEDPVTKILASIQGEDSEDTQSAILCKQCDHLITTPEELLTIGDKFIHCFTNPAGISFEIQCFSSAVGALVSGNPTDYYSWFPGYSWQYCYCNKCNSHLGWYFQKEDNGFYGLNLAMLKGEI